MIQEPLIIECKSTQEANIFYQENEQRYRLSENLSEQGQYIFIKRSKEIRK